MKVCNVHLCHKSHTINEYQYLKFLRTSRNFRFEMHQAGCGDAVLHYNYELGYGYEGRNPSKQRKRERLALLHLPTNPHAPPKGQTKLTLSRVPGVFMSKARLGASKSILPLKEKEKTVGG